MREVGDRIKTLRGSQGLSKAALARKVGVNDSTIKRWEEGAGFGGAKVENLFALARTLGISPAALLSGSEPEIAAKLVPLVEQLQSDVAELQRQVRGLMQRREVDKP